MNDLQIFIEKNLGNSYGDVYLFGSTLIRTSINHPLEPFRVTVTVVLFNNWTFSNLMDGLEIDNHIKFYNWLKDIFLPGAEQSYKKHILAKEKVS